MIGRVAVAHADCEGDRPLGELSSDCAAIDRFLSASATVSHTSFAGHSYTGWGGALSLVTWKHPGVGFGPSHGDIALAAAYLDPGDDRHRGVVTLDVSTRFSFERAATRHFFIPYWSFVAGRTFTIGSSGDALPERLFIAPGLGLYLIWCARAGARFSPQVAVQAAYRMPLGDWDKLRGFEYTATLVSSWL